ncbi:MAG TPA: CBS domain-containing protein [Candidatus Acidoferrum sp.]|nr:CBS domain-containing protein [Candidatus Acidoferrum sp.]
MRARATPRHRKGAPPTSGLITGRDGLDDLDENLDTALRPRSSSPLPGRLVPDLERAERGGFPEHLATGTGEFEVPRPELGLRGSPDEPISRIMTRKVICARPEMDASLLRARLLERGVSGAPVVDDWGRVVGVASRTDVIEHEVTSQRGVKTVADIMMPVVFTLPPDAPIGRAAALMAYEGVHRVVVIDHRGCVAGVVSSLDIARWLGWCARYPVGREP